MKVTICELSDERKQFKKDWLELKNYLKDSDTELLLLPEMPFNKWLAGNEQVAENLKTESIAEHAAWIPEIESLAVRYVVYSAPEFLDGRYLNTAFIYDGNNGKHHKIHTKALFPEEPHFWEQSWFDREEKVTFEVLELENLKIGVLLCTELWFTQHARSYGEQGMDILLCPRATGKSSVEQWVNCGRTSAVISGAYCLSSNRSGSGENDFKWGGTGWIAEPTTGMLIGTTSKQTKFLTAEIDLQKSKAAKSEYPLYVNSKLEA